MDDTGLSDAVDRSFVDAFRRLGASDRGLVRRFGSVEVAATGLPSAFFNAVFALRSLDDPSEFSAAVGAVRALGVPFVVHVRPEAAASTTSLAGELKLKQTGVLPGMAMPLPVEVPQTPAGIRLHRVTDQDSYTDFIHVGAEGFGAPPEFLAGLLPAAVFDDPTARGYVAYVDDEPVATAAGLQIEGVLGVYNVATIPTRRRAGYGTAATWAAIADADAGTGATVLQASTMGAPVYERMGFRTVVEYLEFEPGP